MKVSVQVVPPIVRPRFENGIDWGADRRVLARHGDFELWWQSGHKAWIDRMTPCGYYPSQLSVAFLRGRQHTTTIFTGGRLTADRIRPEAIRILDLLMLPSDEESSQVMEKIDRRYTTIFSVSSEK